MVKMTVSVIILYWWEAPTLRSPNSRNNTSAGSRPATAQIKIFPLSPDYFYPPTVSAKLASCLNPLVYAVSHPKFRDAMAKELPCCGIGEKPRDSDTTTVNLTTA